MIRIDRLDHLVLTVRSIEATCAFYAEALGMQVQSFGGGRTALRFGTQTIDLHESGQEIERRAFRPTPGSADIRLLAATPMDAVVAHLRRCGVTIEAGPGPRAAIRSVYVRDPDRNLVEISGAAAAGAAMPVRSAAVPSAAMGAGAAGALALGAAALGAFAVGAMAVGALAVGRVAVGNAHIRRLEIDELIIGDVDSEA